MNIKAILASLILGSSSIAMASPAAPGVTVTSVSYGDTAIRDHRTAPPVNYAQPAPSPIYWRAAYNGHAMPPVYRPVTLAADLQLAANGRKEIWVGPQAGAFTTLKLDATGGRSSIGQVMIQFANGQKQILSLNRTLTGNECVTIDLDGGRRQITRVIVYGALGQTGWRRAPGTFNLTAV